VSEASLSPIDRYWANWMPNKERVAELKVEYRKAERAGDWLAMLRLGALMWAEMTPPRHLPIKNLGVVK
jgi:hypothetical protein